MSRVYPIISVVRLMQKVVYQRVFNTIKLYAKQRRLVTLVTEADLRKENNQMMICIPSHIVWNSGMARADFMSTTSTF